MKAKMQIICPYCGSGDVEELKPFNNVYVCKCGNQFEQYAGKTIVQTDNVNSPSHYTQNKHECIDEMIALFGVEAVKGFCKCNVHKYRSRANYKNGEEDLKKADWYMDKLMELENEE